MKKTLVALAALAAAGGAFAQSGNARAISGSGVEIFGVVDARYQSATATNNGTISRLDNSGESSSRLGFRVMEDLGGGWAAGAWLEAGVNNDDGRGQNTTANATNMGQNFAVGSGSQNGAQAANYTGTVAGPVSSGLNGLQGLTFNRASVISLLNKDLGELRLGRDYVPTFWNLTVYDPFGTVGSGAATNTALGALNPSAVANSAPGSALPAIRASNSIGWLSSDLNGFRIQVMAGLSEIATNCVGFGTVQVSQAGTGAANSCVGASGDGKYAGFRVQYNNGPLSLAAASGQTAYSNAIDAAVITNLGFNVNNLQAGGNLQNVGTYKAVNFGGSYDLKVVKLFAQLGTQTKEAHTSTAYAIATNTYANTVRTDGSMSHNLIGINAPVGNWLLRASYSTAKREAGGTVATELTQTQSAIGAVYNMSKRTAIYGTYSSMSATGVGAIANIGVQSTSTATAGETVRASGLDLGVRHSF